MKHDILDEPIPRFTRRKMKIMRTFMNGIYILMGAVIGLLGSYHLIKLLK